MFIRICLLAIIISCIQAQIELTLPPLPYAYDALEPVLSKHLMQLHHDKHLQTYTTGANKLLKRMYDDENSSNELKGLTNQSIEFILSHIQYLPEIYQVGLKQYGGGYLNHKLFFSTLQKPTATADENKPTGPLLKAIEKAFGSFDKFKQIFTDVSLEVFGSGWVWLYIDAYTKELNYSFAANQENPIMFNKNHITLLGIDLWEHAYYPVYENRRSEYVDNFWRIINWPFVSQLYTEGIAKQTDAIDNQTEDIGKHTGGCPMHGGI
ncbi:unnamed protein product [Adineta steineri]|uniref:superoxide dismutase n=1 Tax=Adineta steineri TaxID=433720 RepID=A0A818PRC9_9BILA|nr:unnamed protein product [Adineta steineri]CAF3627461.1 unnamed protein product [Adineta steineri]